MKKFHIFLPLFLASFFFSTFVYADTYNLEINESDFDLLNTTEFIELKEYMDNIVATNSLDLNNSKRYYYIYKAPGGLYYAFLYKGFILDENTSSNYLEIYQDPYFCGQGNYNTCDVYYHRNGSPTLSNTYTYDNNSLHRKFYSSSVLRYYNYLYSNFDLIKSTSNTYNISYNDYHFTISSTSTAVPTLYDIYQDLNSQPEDTTPILTSFYTIIFDKIIDLCNYFVSSYIYIAIICIFILIFLLNLLRRYLL